MDEALLEGRWSAAEGVCAEVRDAGSGVCADCRLGGRTPRAEPDSSRSAELRAAPTAGAICVFELRSERSGVLVFECDGDCETRGCELLRSGVGIRTSF